MLEDMGYMLQANHALFFTLIGILGLCVGSFLNVVIHRIPIMLERQWSGQIAQADGTGFNQSSFNLFFPRSHCPQCKKPIAFLCNIPIFSYLFLNGRSACCRKPISIRYPLIEALSMGLSILVAFRFGLSWETLATLIFTWTLIALFFIDIDQKILPDSLTLPLLWTGIVFNSAHLFTSLEAAICGAILGYCFFWAIAFLFKFLRKIEGLGQGDFKLLAACGAWVGWQLLPFIVFFSSVLGLIVSSIYLISTRQSARTQIPFGPFIAIAAFTAILYGNSISSAYVNFLESIH
jgi:leader peptidase (prepilin peptidase)/N-methyltransferase